MLNDKNGYIVVETVGAFLPFLLLIISILSLVNIVTLQSRVHYALTQAANTLSVYSYALEVTGIAEDLTELDNHASKVGKEADEIKKDINEVLAGIDSLSMGDVKVHGEAAAKKVLGWGESIADDPQAAIQIMMNYQLGEGSKEIFEYFIRPLVGRYLGNGDMTGDEYLKSVNVIDGLKGLDFYDFDLFNSSSLGENDSILIDKNGNVKLVVRYEIEYRFGSLPLPFEPKLTVTQVVKTKAWLNGSGKGYW